MIINIVTLNLNVGPILEICQENVDTWKLKFGVIKLFARRTVMMCLTCYLFGHKKVSVK